VCSSQKSCIILVVRGQNYADFSRLSFGGFLAFRPFLYLDVEPAEEHEYDVGVVLLDSNDEGRVPVAVANVRICLG
jgi:hypothetical protein